MTEETVTIDILDSLEDDETTLVADGFDGAFIGILRPWQTQFQPVVLYSRAKCLEILVAEHDMSEEEAEEYFEFNVAGGYLGIQTPMFL